MILVVGDVIHDQWFGLEETGRRDPATRAKIYRVNRCHIGVGGAGMVAAMTSSLGAETQFLSVGPSANAPCLLLHHHYEVVVGLVEEKGRSIPVKSRIPVTANGIRLDIEDAVPVSEDTTEQLCQLATYAAERGCQWCVVADYGKGVVTPALARTLVGLFGRGLIVDPAPGRAWGRWTGAGILKCNAKQAGGRTPKELVERFDLHGAVVTQGAGGATWCIGDRTGGTLGRSALEVDATGCGDQFLAVLAIGMSRGAEFRSAVDTANMIASMQAERETIVPVRPADLRLLTRRERDRCREVLGT